MKNNLKKTQILKKKTCQIFKNTKKGIRNSGNKETDSELGLNDLYTSSLFRPTHSIVLVESFRSFVHFKYELFLYRQVHDSAKKTAQQFNNFYLLKIVIK